MGRFLRLKRALSIGNRSIYGVFFVSMSSVLPYRQPMFRSLPSSTLFFLAIIAFLGAVHGQVPATKSATVYVFLHPECVISRYYTLSLRELHERYSPEGIAFVGVFPDQNSTEAERKAFATRFNLPFAMQDDPGLVLTSQLGARITPEVVLVDTTGYVWYRGRVDDRYYKIGGIRARTNEHDLSQALADWRDGLLTEPRFTEAVGCYIQGVPLFGTETPPHGLPEAPNVVAP
ncbi:MAG: redoxin family protein [Bacteroidetes bacterium]|nr:redoxin family protein [Bacteroidota bacterium]